MLEEEGRNGWTKGAVMGEEWSLSPTGGNVGVVRHVKSKGNTNSIRPASSLLK